MIPCGVARALAGGYAEKSINLVSGHEVEVHLAQCHECREYYRQHGIVEVSWAGAALRARRRRRSMSALLMAAVLAAGLLAGYFGWSYRLHLARAPWASLAAGVVVEVGRTVTVGAYTIMVESIVMLRDRTDVFMSIRQPELDRVMGGFGGARTVVPGTQPPAAGPMPTPLILVTIWDDMRGEPVACLSQEDLSRGEYVWHCPPLGAEARPVRLEFEYPQAAVRAAVELPPGP